MNLGDSLALKVATRYLRAKSFGDPKVLLAKFQSTLDKYILPEKDLREARELFRGSVWNPNNQEHKKAKILAYEAARNTANGSSELADAGRPLFLSILQSYSLQPALRKKIEAAAKVYAKAYRPRQKEKSFEGIYAEYIEQYESYFNAAEQYLLAAREAIKEGKEHSETPTEDTSEVATKMQVGGFTLVNTGGFPEKTMNEVADLTQKASAFLHSKGLGKVCYGNILVTNSLKANKVLAFYMLAEDELLVRANFKNERDTLRTILHELGHRYQFQFMKGRDAEVKAFYRWMEGEEDDRLKDKRDELIPKKGDTITVKGIEWEAVSTIPSPSSSGIKYFVNMQTVEQPPIRGKMDLEGWLSFKGIKLRDFNDPTLRGFVTEYAKRGGPEENFAEVFSIYCLGKLRNDYKEAFEILAFGRSKTAASEGSLWNAAVKEVTTFNKNYAKLLKIKAPLSDSDAKLLITFSSEAAGKLPGSYTSSFTTWASTCAQVEFSNRDEELRASRSELRNNRIFGVIEHNDGLPFLKERIESHMSIVQDLMSSAAPASFTYQGFKVTNPERMSDAFCRQTLEGVDFLKALFKKRGVDAALYDGVTEIKLVPDSSFFSNKKAAGLYSSDKREISLSGSIGSEHTGRFIQWVNEVFLHEFGHFVHMTFITGEARAAWDAGWKTQNSEGEVLVVTQGDRQRLFEVLKSNSFNLQAAYGDLDPEDKTRYLAWLGQSKLGAAVAELKGKTVKPTRFGTETLLMVKYPDRFPDYGPGGMKPSDVEFEKKRIDAAMKRMGLDNPVVLEVPKGKADMADLGIVSDYGATNEKEDFAETFVAFMAAPEKLTPTSKFRMQRALSLSGLYGKPVMKLAEDPVVEAVIARYTQENYPSC